MIIKIKKKRVAFTLIIGVYTALLAYTSLYVPIKAVLEMGNGETYTEYGYYPVWGLGGLEAANPGLRISLNIRAWVIQYVFLTLVFMSLWYRVSRYFREREHASRANRNY